MLAASLKALREDEVLSPDLVFRDTYFLDFLGLKDYSAEKGVESAILRELEALIRLRRLVALDLKLGKFQAADKGQMELYLRWLAKHDTQPGVGVPRRG